MYNLDIKPSCKKNMEKASNRNPVLKKAIENKVSEILENPERYKPLMNAFAGERRVHILKSFVLRYEVPLLEKIAVVCATALLNIP